jgi:hypothetical protein
VALEAADLPQPTARKRNVAPTDADRLGKEAANRRPTRGEKRSSDGPRAGEKKTPSPTDLELHARRDQHVYVLPPGAALHTRGRPLPR